MNWHTRFQQRNENSGPPASDRNGMLESSASAAGTRIAAEAALPQMLPACGAGLAQQHHLVLVKLRFFSGSASPVSHPNPANLHGQIP
jgi:hypothetical protein